MIKLKYSWKIPLIALLNLILLIVVINIGVCIYRSVKIDKTVLKNKETLIASIKEDEESLNELIIYLDSIDYDIIAKRTEPAYSGMNYGYKTYKNNTLEYIFEKYKLNCIYSIWKKRKIINFDISKNKKGVDYWGFYYSYDGEPRGEFEDARDPLVKDGAGYRTTANYTYYTEHITGNWYYYETYWYHGLWK